MSAREDSLDAVAIAWTVGFSITVVVATLGNGIVLWIILGMILFDLTKRCMPREPRDTTLATSVKQLCVIYCITIYILIDRSVSYAGHRQMWSSTNYFLVNLSVVDLLMALLNTIFNFIFMRDR